MQSNHHSIADLRREARRWLPRPVFEYLDGGAEDELSLRRSAVDYDEVTLIPRVLNDVATISRGVRLFGRDLTAPLILSPTGLSGLYHPEAERAVARAAGAAGLPYALSTLGTASIEEVAASTTGPKLLQLYIFRDRMITAGLMERAAAAGYDGLIVTVDTPVGGNRERDRRNGMTVPPKLTPRSLIDFALHPRWSLPALMQPKRFLFGNLPMATDAVNARTGPSVNAFMNEQMDRSLTWHDVEWVRSRWQGALAIKGVLSASDAVQAVAVGADTVIVSNHGGRQLDGAASPISRIAPIADALAGSAAIICDGGVRRGVHIAKALALGATACSVGRPYLYGLTIGGEKGVTRALEILLEEFDRCLTLMGVAESAALDRTLVTGPENSLCAWTSARGEGAAELGLVPLARSSPTI